MTEKARPADAHDLIRVRGAREHLARFVAGATADAN
jgi:hypothetical protein